MKELLNDKAKKAIRESLRLNEALTAQEKKFTFNADLLSTENFNNHVELYKGYLNNFNKSLIKSMNNE